MMIIPRIANMVYDQAQEKLRKAKGNDKQVVLPCHISSWKAMAPQRQVRHRSQLELTCRLLLEGSVQQQNAVLIYSGAHLQAVAGGLCTTTKRSSDLYWDLWGYIRYMAQQCKAT